MVRPSSNIWRSTGGPQQELQEERANNKCRVTASVSDNLGSYCWMQTHCQVTTLQTTPVARQLPHNKQIYGSRYTTTELQQ
jgi:hypothetical protein